MKVLTAAQVVALGGAVKKSDLDAAKRSLAAGSSQAVDFVVRITGNVTKDHGTPANSGTHPATADLFQRAVMADALRRLKIRPCDFRKALQAAASLYDQTSDLSPEHQKFTQVIDEESCSLAEGMPPVPWATKPREGAARTGGVSYQVLNPKGDQSCRLAA